MKTYVLFISDKFPVYHPKGNTCHQTDFETQIEWGFKIHTIRQNYDFWEPRIRKIQKGKAVLSIRRWVGKPYGKGSTTEELFRFHKLDGVGIEPIYQTLDLFYFDSELRNQASSVMLAKNDGLSLEDFEDWFGRANQIRKMAIIHFTEFRYNEG